MTWIHPNTIIGSPAEGDRYLRRPDINSRFWKAISDGEHVLFTAPRRVGKSSVMLDIERIGMEGMLIKYQNIQSDKRSQVFYKRICNLIIEQMNTVDSLKNRLTHWLKGRKVEEFSIEGSFKLEKAEIDYKAELLTLISQLGEEKHKVVLLLDEFPDVISSIYTTEGPEAASEVLHTLRSIRQNKKFKNFTLVLAGSISLEHVVASFERTAVINDLVSVPIPPLTITEGNELLSMLLNDATIKLNEDARQYLFKKLEHLLPYYIQLMVVQCDQIAETNTQPIISNEVIDQAFEEVSRLNDKFSDWENRLAFHRPKEDYLYCIGLLTRCAHGNYTMQEAYNFSRKHNLSTGFRNLLDDVLIKDGYLVSDGTRLRFLSPFLKAWWAQRHQAYEIED